MTKASAARLTVLAGISTLISVGAAVTPCVAGAAADPATVCAGDCGGDRRVTIEELTGCVRALMNATDPAPHCCDADGDAVLSVADVTVAVNHALIGCTTPCIGFHAHLCDVGERCDVWDGFCEGAWANESTSACVAIPADCPPDDDPVCGCNGVTYANDCERQRAGASRQAAGVCATFHCCPAGAIATGAILVDFQPDIGEDMAAAIAAMLGASVMRHYANIGTYLISVPPGHELELVARFAARPEVVTAGANHVGCIPEAYTCACCPPSDRIICPNLPPCIAP